MLLQYLRVHASGPQYSQPPGIGDRGGQTPSTGPDHTGLDDGVLNPEEFSNPVFHENANWDSENKGKYRSTPIRGKRDLGLRISPPSRAAPPLCTRPRTVPGLWRTAFPQNPHTSHWRPCTGWPFAGAACT